MTITQVLDKFLSNLTPSETEEDAARSNRESIRNRLSSDFETTELLRSGSFGHGTSVKGYSDIDYFAITPTAKLKQNSKSTLQAFRLALKDRFPSNEIVVRDPAVIIPFASYYSLKHEIIPADYDRTENGNRIFEIPDRRGGWMTASPSGHNSWVTAENVRLGGKLKQLIRLMKAWNYYNRVGLRSFYIEMRTTERAKLKAVIIYKIDILHVFRYLKNKSLAAMRDPLGLTHNIEPCSDAVISGALSKIDSAITRAEKALACENEGNTYEAYQWWDAIFNHNLPRYYG